jgi:ABC-type dipeptide/oligopeptide/nickel transport system permease subunit
VLPLPLLLIAPAWPAALALATGIGTRLLLAWRFRQPVLSAVLQPFGIVALLVVQWFSLVRAARGGRATWRGRAYPAQ